MDTFSFRFWKIPGKVRKLEWSKTSVHHKTPGFSTKQSLESLPEVFLTGEPNTNEKKTARKHQFIALLAVWREKQGCIFGNFFVWVPIFDPTLVQYFIQIPHIVFCPLSAYDKWWFEQKNHHIFGKSILLWATLRQDPPLDLSFWSFLTFLHHNIEEVETHLLWKFHKKIRRKSWSNVPPKLLACIGFLYKVVHKIGRLRKFSRSREIEFNFFYRLDYLHEIWHTCSACPWLQNVASDFLSFA